MNFTTKRRILNIIAVIFAVVMVLFNKFVSETLLGVTLLMLFVIAYLILSLIWWRCPHCNSYLHKLTPFSTHCPYCGNKLE